MVHKLSLVHDDALDRRFQGRVLWVLQTVVNAGKIADRRKRWRTLTRRLHGCISVALQTMVQCVLAADNGAGSRASASESSRRCRMAD